MLPAHSAATEPGDVLAQALELVLEGALRGAGLAIGAHPHDQTRPADGITPGIRSLTDLRR